MVRNGYIVLFFSACLWQVQSIENVFTNNTDIFLDERDWFLYQRGLDEDGVLKPLKKAVLRGLTKTIDLLPSNQSREKKQVYFFIVTDTLFRTLLVNWKMSPVDESNPEIKIVSNNNKTGQFRFIPIEDWNLERDYETRREFEEQYIKENQGILRVFLEALDS